MKVITTKVNQAIGLLQKLQKTLLRLVIITMYKAFVRPYLDYGNMIYDEACNKTFHQKLESIQYNTSEIILPMYFEIREFKRH